MIPDMFKAFELQFLNEMHALLTRKGVDYSNESDRLSDFRCLAVLTCQTPSQVWAVYAMKHMQILLTWARTNQMPSESLRGRFVDLANYCLLGAALAADQAPAPSAPGPVLAPPPDRQRSVSLPELNLEAPPA